MARISAARFGGNVKNVCAKSEIVMRVVSISEGELHLRFRVFLVDRSFLDVYYNQENGKTAFAHIFHSTRIFGADNTLGVWHWHPHEDPKMHSYVENEISFAEFLRQVEAHLTKP
jgi:hypothetical protein